MTKLTIYARRPVNVLKGLQETWENDRPIRHAQTTGMILHQMYLNPQLTVESFLPLILRFIERHGPYGIDGILLTAMGLANKIKSPTYFQAVDTIDLMKSEIMKHHKPSFGIYFADLEILAKSNQLNGGLLPLQKILLSSLSDGFRDEIFGGALANIGFFDNTLPTGSFNNKDFGSSVRGMMGEQLLMHPNSMISVTEEEKCIQGWGVAGAVAGLTVGGVAAGPPGAAAGGFAGYQAGKLRGMYVCGSSTDNGDTTSVTASANDQTGSANVQTGNNDGDSQNTQAGSDGQNSNSTEPKKDDPDNSADQSGMCTEADHKASTIVPEMETSSNDAGVFVLAALGLVDPSGSLHFPDQSHIFNPVQNVEGLGSGNYLITYDPNVLISLFAEESSSQNQMITDDNLLKIAFRLGSLIDPVFAN